jgi:hypothetical protein
VLDVMLLFPWARVIAQKKQTKTHTMPTLIEQGLDLHINVRLRGDIAGLADSPDSSRKCHSHGQGSLEKQPKGDLSLLPFLLSLLFLLPVLCLCLSVCLFPAQGAGARVQPQSKG